MRSQATSCAVKIGGAAVAAATLLSIMTIVPAAQAYQPAQTAFYTASAEDKANFNKKNPILYPKSAQLEDGTLVATFERSVGDPVGQTMPIYRSTDYGTTWESLSEVQSPAVLTKGTNREAEFAKYTSAWTNPYLYVMPETVGGLSKGTLLLAAIVSGDDPYLKEQLKANPNFNRTSDDFDRKDVALALYFSTDGGKDWSFLNIIAEGSWQGSYGGPFATENTTHQNDPVWEPFLMVYDGQLVCYYSDENEFDWSTYNKETGAIQLHAENGTDPEDGGSGQILAHKTWDGVSASWGDVVVDEAGFELKGKYAGGGRAGMTTVAHTTDDKWLMTFEWWKGGESNVQYKIADNPLEFSKVDRQPIFKLSGCPPVVARCLSSCRTAVFCTTLRAAAISGSMKPVPVMAHGSDTRLLLARATAAICNMWRKPAVWCCCKAHSVASTFLTAKWTWASQLAPTISWSIKKPGWR